MDSRHKEALKNLCFSHGWSYGAFWHVNRSTSALLTLEDAYYEEQIRIVIERMRQQAHLLGEGIIGRAAFTGKHQWMFSDSYYGECGSTGSVNNQDVFQDDSEFHHQFLSGIKTIAVISVAPQGVVQFGSSQKIQENLEFVDEVKSVFRSLGSVGQLILSGEAASNLNSEIYNLSSLFGSAELSENSYSCSGNLKSFHDDSCKELMGTSYSTTSFTSGFHHDSMNPLGNHFQTAGAESEAQVILLKHNIQSPQVLLHSTSSLANKSFTRTPSISTYCSENSTRSSSEGQLLPGLGLQGSQNVFSAGLDTLLSRRNTCENFQGDSTYNSFCRKDGLLNSNTGLLGVFQGESTHNSSCRKDGLLNANTGLLELNKSMGNISDKLVGIEHPVPNHNANEGEFPKASSITHMFEEFKLDKAIASLSKPNPVNNLSQLIAPPLAQGNEDLSQALGFASVSSGLAGRDEFTCISVDHGASSMQSSITDTMNSLGAVCDGKEDSLNVAMQLPADNDLFDGLGLSFRHSHEQKCWEDIVIPVGRASNSSISECISPMDIDSMTQPQKGFFSDLGVEQLFNDVVSDNSLTKPTSEDQLSTMTMTRTGSSSMYSGQVHLVNLSCLGGSTSVLLPQCNLEKATSMNGSQKEMVLKSQVGSWVDDSQSLNAESAVITQAKRSEEPTKVTRKRARPGESTRPRPKDRQQIQDRVKELREIVPNGAKCSIDALLDRTIKHMLFLQSVTKYADKLKQSNEPKMIGQESGVVLKDNSSAGAGGATWAFEVSGQTMVCPIIVEDLNPPGQMLVEMLCQERGFFLEIADMIRGFGLTILKGLIEARDDKIWARFVVEANRDITRMDIFLSLVQLLQQTTSGISSSNQPSKFFDSGVPSFSNYQQSPLPLPISLADRTQ